jgi:hypothetical protein
MSTVNHAVGKVLLKISIIGHLLYKCIWHTGFLNLTRPTTIPKITTEKKKKTHTHTQWKWYSWVYILIAFPADQRFSRSELKGLMCMECLWMLLGWRQWWFSFWSWWLSYKQHIDIKRHNGILSYLLIYV